MYGYTDIVREFLAVDPQLATLPVTGDSRRTPLNISSRTSIIDQLIAAGADQ